MILIKKRNKRHNSSFPMGIYDPPISRSWNAIYTCIKKMQYNDISPLLYHYYEVDRKRLTICNTTNKISLHIFLCKRHCKKKWKPLIEYSAIKTLQIRHKAYRVVECVISKLKMHCSAKINMKTILVMRFCNARYSFVHTFHIM